MYCLNQTLYHLKIYISSKYLSILKNWLKLWLYTVPDGEYIGVTAPEAIGGCGGGHSCCGGK